MEVAKVNIPVAVLIWLMIIPMLLRVDFGALHEVKEHWRGIGLTLFINWGVKPFSMALLGWLFIGTLFRPYLSAEQIDSYIAGLIILATAPCTAMVFVGKMMALQTGQRQGDLLKATWSAYDGRWLEVHQSKAGCRVHIPCSKNLIAALDKEHRQAVTIMTSRKGPPWKADNFRQRWRATARRAGIENLTFHDLRGTFITLLTQAGATPQQIATISGHSLPASQKILDTYTSWTKETALAAMELFATTWAAKVTTELTTATSIKAEKSAKSLK